MLHIALHVLLPVATAALFYRPHLRHAVVVLLLTMIVDLDHLLATPIYDPARCSIGFHPLHTAPAIAGYGLLFVLPLALERHGAWRGKPVARTAHLAGLGLLLHMALDWSDCLL